MRRLLIALLLVAGCEPDTDSRNRSVYGWGDGGAAPQIDAKTPPKSTEAGLPTPTPKSDGLKPPPSKVHPT